MTTLNNEMEFEQKKLIHTGDLDNHKNFVIPLCLLDNTDASADYFCHGTLTMKRTNGNHGINHKIGVNVTKKYDESEPVFNFQVDGNETIELSPVKFSYNGQYYFGILGKTVGAATGNVEFVGKCHDWEQLEVIYYYDNASATYINNEIYSSIVYLDEQGEQHRFHGDVIAPNIITKNDNRFERKEVIYAGPMDNHKDFVIPLCLLKNDDKGAGHYCNGTITMRNPGGINGGMDFKIHVRAIKKYDSEEPSFNLQIDGGKESYNAYCKISPVKFLYSDELYFGLYAHTPDAGVGNIEFTGSCSDWDVLSYAYVCKNEHGSGTGAEAEDIINQEIKDSLVFLDGEADQCVFFGNVYAPNVVTEDKISSKELLNRLIGVSGSGNKLDADMLDGYHYNDIIDYVSDSITNIRVGARNLVLNSWIEEKSDKYGFACREAKVVKGESYVFSAMAQMQVAETTSERYGKISISNSDNSFSQSLEFKTTDKERKFIVFTAKTTETLQIRSYYFPTPSDNAGGLYVEYYKLEIGNKMTDWLPAPEDLDEKISLIAQSNQGKGGSGIGEESDPIFNKWRKGTDIAIGSDSYAINGSIAIGSETTSTENYSVAVGSAVSSREYSVAIGRSAEASETSTALGARTQSLGGMATAVGANSVALGSWATALGANSKSLGDWATAVGSNSKALGNWSTAVGANACALGRWSTAIGTHASTSENESYVIKLGDSNISEIRSYKTSITYASDIRDKTDIEFIDKALEFINSIQPIRYVYNFREKYLKKAKETPEYEEITEEVVLEDEFVTITETNERGEEITVQKPRVIQIKKKVEKELTDEQRRQNEVVNNRKKYGLSDYDTEAHEKGLKKGNRKRVGISAQQVEEVLKKLYDTDNYANIVNDNFHDLNDIPEGVESVKSANYEGFIPFLIGAVQELSQKVNDLEIEINEIKDNLL